MKLLRKKGVRSLIIILLISLMSLSIVANASAATTGIYLGVGFAYKENGFVDTEIRGYVYYNSNNTSQIDVHSLCQWVFNNGVAPVNQFEYCVNTSSYSKYTIYSDYATTITQNNYKRMEQDWATACYLYHYNYDTTYSKEGSYAFIEILAANSLLGGATWDSYWYASSPGTNYSADFYY